MCWDDSLVAVGTEVGSIELYSVKKILIRAEQAQREQKNDQAQDHGAHGQNGTQAHQSQSNGASSS